MQKTHSNAVFHPAKLASGANYPVGWVQMPHSVKTEGRRGIGQGQGLRAGGWRGDGGVEGLQFHPGVQSPCLNRLDLAGDARGPLWLLVNLFVPEERFALLQPRPASLSHSYMLSELG